MSEKLYRRQGRAFVPVETFQREGEQTPATGPSEPGTAGRSSAIVPSPNGLQIRSQDREPAELQGDGLPPKLGTRRFKTVTEVQQSAVHAALHWLYNSDIAYRRNRQLQRMMRHDPEIMSPLMQRQMATALLDWSIVPEDERDEEQVEMCRLLKNDIERLRKWPEFLRHLLDAIWYGPSMANVVYATDEDSGRVFPDEWFPFHPDSVVYDESGKVGFRVGYEHPKKSKIPHYDGGWVSELTELERKSCVLHTFNTTAPDFEEEYEARYLYSGRGLRDFVWFHWLVKQTLYQLWTTYAERYGMGNRIGKYPEGNATGKAQMEEVLKNLQHDVTVLIPNIKDHPDGYGIEIQEVQGRQGSVFAEYGEVLSKSINKLIVGQEALSEGVREGLGTGVSDRQAETFQRLNRFDAMNLEDTLTRDLVAVLHEMNNGKTDWRPRFKFSVEEVDSQEFMDGVKKAYDMGMAIKERQVRERLGLDEPQDDDAVLEQQDPMAGGFGPGGEGPAGGDGPGGGGFGGGGGSGGGAPSPKPGGFGTFGDSGFASRFTRDRAAAYEAETFAFVESKHNRHPKGSSKGGQFAPKSGGGDSGFDAMLALDAAVNRDAAIELRDQLIADGGFTYEPMSDTQPSTGYAVSPYRDRERTYKIDEITEQDIADFMEANADVLEDPRTTVGGWYDKENGVVYLDVSMVIEDQAEAEALGIEHRQEAIYDLGTGTEIRLGARGDDKLAASRALSMREGGRAGGDSGSHQDRLRRAWLRQSGHDAGVWRRYGVDRGWLPQTFAFDESKVNRHPEGSPRGGQFAPKASAAGVMEDVGTDESVKADAKTRRQAWERLSHKEKSAALDEVKKRFDEIKQHVLNDRHFIFMDNSVELAASYNYMNGATKGITPPEIAYQFADTIEEGQKALEEAGVWDESLRHDYLLGLAKGLPKGDPDTMGAFSPMENAVSINPWSKGFADTRSWNKISVAQSNADVHVHEYAHAIHLRPGFESRFREQFGVDWKNIFMGTDFAGRPTWWKMEGPDGRPMRNWLEEATRKEGLTFADVRDPNDIYSISHYASTHPLEYVAEAFLWQVKGNRLDEKQQELYDYLLGPPVPERS